MRVNNIVLSSHFQMQNNVSSNSPFQLNTMNYWAINKERMSVFDDMFVKSLHFSWETLFKTKYSNDIKRKTRIQNACYCDIKSVQAKDSLGYSSFWRGRKKKRSDICGSCKNKKQSQKYVFFFSYEIFNW